MEYRIGDFATITRLSIKVLRNYHENRLLIPTRIDAGSGYRYYDESLINRARIIMTLRNWDFSLREIGEILNEYNEDGDILGIVRSKREEIKSRINKLHRIEEELSMLINYEEEMIDMDRKSEITIKKVDEMKIISITYRGPYSDCGKYMGKLFRTAKRNIAGTVFNMYPKDIDHDNPEVTVCLPVKDKIEHPEVEYRVLPSTRVLSTIHHGPYETIGNSYQRLIDHKNEFAIKDNEKEMGREIYLKGPGMLFAGNPKKYVTEIQIPIEG